jgi:hypothetical protein
MRKYVTEFIGTFGLAFTLGAAVMSKAALVPLASPEFAEALRAFCKDVVAAQ